MGDTGESFLSFLWTGSGGPFRGRCSGQTLGAGVGLDRSAVVGITLRSGTVGCCRFLTVLQSEDVSKEVDVKGTGGLLGVTRGGTGGGLFKCTLLSLFSLFSADALNFVLSLGTGLSSSFSSSSSDPASEGKTLRMLPRIRFLCPGRDTPICCSSADVKSRHSRSVPSPASLNAKLYWSSRRTLNHSATGWKLPDMTGK